MIIEQIAEAIAAHSVAMNLLSFFGGLFLGHRLAVAIEQHKALIAASLPIRKWLIEEIERPTLVGAPSEFDIQEVVRRLGWFKRRGFITAYRAQQSEREKARRNRDSAGQGQFIETETIKKHLRKCLTYLNAK